MFDLIACLILEVGVFILLTTVILLMVSEFALSVKSGQIRNMESARVSMGGQVKKYVSFVSHLQTGRHPADL